MSFFKMILPLLLCFTCYGCYATRALYYTGMHHDSIDKIEEAYLMDNKTLVIKGSKNIHYYYHDKKSNMLTGINLEQTRHKMKSYTPSGPYIDNHNSFLGNKMYSLVRKDNLAVKSTILSSPELIKPEFKEEYRIPILTDENVTTLENPFIYIHGGYYFINKIDEGMVNVILLQLSNGISKEPIWQPIKYPFYLLTVPFDIITFFPFQAMVWESRGYD